MYKRQDLEQSYDKLILATGSIPVRPEIKGMDLENVQFVKLFQNAQDVIEKLKDASIRKIAVVGAGYIGVELAEAVSYTHLDVYKRQGNSTPLGVTLSSVFFGTLKAGALSIERTTDVSRALADVIKGIIICFVSVRTLGLLDRISFKWPGNPMLRNKGKGTEEVKNVY